MDNTKELNDIARESTGTAPDVAVFLKAVAQVMANDSQMKSDITPEAVLCYMSNVVDNADGMYRAARRDPALLRKMLPEIVKVFEPIE